MKIRIIIFFGFLLGFFSCEKTVVIGGHLYFKEQQDKPLGGITVGLYKMKKEVDSFGVESTWDGLDLIGESITDTSGYFSFEVDEDEQVAGSFIFIRQPVDTISENSRYSNVMNNRIDFSLTNKASLTSSALVKFNRKNFNDDYYLIKYGNVSVNDIVPGNTYTIMVFRSGNGIEEYIGKTTKCIKKVLPVKSEKVFWDLPVIEVEIDFNQLRP